METIVTKEMIDLKAELFRKQEEYKQLKAHNSSDFVKGVKSNKHEKGDKIWSRKNPGVLQRAGRDLAEKEEEDNVMERSRKALEAKSRIYEKIASASGIPEEDGSEGFLVDFQRKAVDRIVEQRRGGEGPVSAKAPSNGNSTTGHGELDDDTPSQEPLPLPASPGEEWVDYVDSFGRSRRCMRKDLPELQQQQRPLGRPPGDGGLKLKEGATLLSADMKRELRRQQWEKEAEDSANGPLHYANVQFDEIRTHGTGFYQFSKDSNLREEQMDMLNKLREQTMDGRQRSERIKEKRKAALEARLNKVKQRRKMKDGSVLGPDDAEKEEKEEQKAAEASKAQEPEPLTRDDSWRRSAPVREWDLGKEKLPEWNAKRYMEQKRSERENEFAPPESYFDHKRAAPPTASPPRDARSQNSTGCVTQPSTCAPSDVDSMLKRIRHFGGPQPLTSEPIHQDLRPSSKESSSHADSETGVDVASIPLPEMVSAKISSQSVKDEQGQRAGTICEDSQTTGQAGVGQARQQMDWVGSISGYFHAPPPPVQTGVHPLQPTFSAPVPDVSVPPPGFPLPPLAQHTGGAPSTQPVAPSFTPTGEEGSCVRAPFVYPSQQGLLSFQPQSRAEPQSTPQTDPPEPKAKASIPKASMVDKRFMQNREVSEEDLLGYMAHTSTDPLTQIQPVSYTPGHFTSSAVSQLRKSDTSEEAAVEKPTPATGESATPAAKPAAQTEGVIFGVPDFLQPATVAATTYQPGSFMAAKEAAAQRAEEEYEAARKKTQYSSAPVLYDRPDGSDYCEQVESESRQQGKKDESAGTQQGDEADAEFAKFLKEVGGKR